MKTAAARKHKGLVGAGKLPAAALIVALLVVLQLFAASIAGANGAMLENGSFDSPVGFSGWTTSPVAGQVGNGCSASDGASAVITACTSAQISSSGLNETVNPLSGHGSYFALLQAGAAGIPTMIS